MNNFKYLLYIDILGFSDLVRKDYKAIEALFSRIDSLNVHRHGDFQTIVFSDTILVFNKVEPMNEHDKEYLIMFACEFVQDLLFRCIDIEIQFRAILTYGEFNYSKLENIDAYYGKALVDSYYKEKDINGQGLFISNKLLEYNTIFPTIQFDADLHFVYLTQTIERLNRYEFTSTPLDPYFIQHSMEFPYLEKELKMLKTLHINIENQLDSKIRSKYLQTYHLYKQRYGDMIAFFEKNDFDYRAISPQADWADIEQF